MEKFDVVVIGAGPGGYPAAIRAAQLGAAVAIVEKEFVGGTCLNWGCIPTKALRACSDFRARVARAQEYGLRVGGVEPDYGAMVRRKDTIVRGLRAGIERLLKTHGVQYLQGTAAFTDRRHVAVHQTAGELIMLTADKFIVATGSAAIMPEAFPRHARILESRGFLELPALPPRLLVVGGGFIGCEFACLAAELGVQVTVVELLEDVLLSLDADVRREVRCHMEQKLGIKILAGQPLTEVTADDHGVQGRCGTTTLTADLMLVATGRRPVTGDLNLAAVGLQPNDAGALATDDYGRTSAANIFAVGDVAGRFQLAHAATSHGITAAENACRQTQRRLESVVPMTIFAAPEIGVVGLTEQAARAAGRDVKIGKYPFAHLGKALAAGETEGFVKWIADPATGCLLGAQVVGPRATELIAEATLAIRAELTAEEFADTVHAHPTFAEAAMEAAYAVLGQCVHLPPPRR